MGKCFDFVIYDGPGYRSEWISIAVQAEYDLGPALPAGYITWAAQVTSIEGIQTPWIASGDWKLIYPKGYRLIHKAAKRAIGRATKEEA